MPLTPLQSTIRNKLTELFNSHPLATIDFGRVGGGCINDTYRIHFDNQQLFCKVNSATKFPHLFEKETHGLKIIAQQNVIKAPAVIDCFESAGDQVLILEWVNEGERTEVFWKRFGEQLAAFHQMTNEYFGLEADNYMGSVPQSNRANSNWTDFFKNERLQPLIHQGLSEGLLSSRHQDDFEKLCQKLPSFFAEDQEPSLLHGDLWSGNFMCNKASEPVLIDPAVYFGHPSIDLGMTTLFGGFRNGFYEAYNYHSPLPRNHKEQWDICNLYPLLIHLLLFGRSYLSQIENILHRYC